MRSKKPLRWILAWLFIPLLAANSLLASAQAPPPMPLTVIFLTQPPDHLCKGDSFTVLVNIIQPGVFVIPMVNVTASLGRIEPPSPVPLGVYLYQFDYHAEQAGPDIINLTAISPIGGVGVGTLPVNVENCRYRFQMTGTVTVTTTAEVVFNLESIGDGETTFQASDSGQIDASGDLALNDSLVVQASAANCYIDQPYQGQFPFTLSGSLPQNPSGQVSIHVDFGALERGPGSNVVCTSPQGSGSVPIPINTNLPSNIKVDFSFPEIGGTDTQTGSYGSGPVAVNMLFVATLTRESTQ